MTVVFKDNSGSRAGEFPEGSCLLGALTQLGADLPAYCGGHGRCRGCEVLLTAGRFELPGGEAVLNPGDAGITARSCLVKARGERVEVAACNRQESGFSAQYALSCSLKPEEIRFRDWAIAIDLGSTTLAAALLHEGSVLRCAGAVNPQRKFGNNVLDRIKCAGEDYAAVRAALLQGIAAAVASLEVPEDAVIRKLVLAGNPVMSRFAANLPVADFGHYPFKAKESLPMSIPAAELGLNFPCSAEFFPDLGGFVGGDVVSGLYAANMLEENSPEPAFLADLGTNCEMVLRQDGVFYAVSAAAGPGFESVEADSVLAANVEFVNHRFTTLPLSDPPCNALSAAALTDVLWILRRQQALDEAGHLDAGVLQRMHLSAVLNNEIACRITPGITLRPERIMEFLTAKAALRACQQLLLETCHIEESRLKTVIFAGGMAKFLNLDSARGTGLVSGGFPEVRTCGNTALSGAVKVILAGAEIPEIPAGRCRILQPGDYPGFSRLYTNNLFFPPADGEKQR